MKGQTNGNHDIPVVSAINENNRKKKKLMEYLPIVVIIVLIIAVIITVAVVKSKKSNKEEPAGFVTENAGDFIVPSDEEGETDTSPVTFSEDVEVTFEGISLDFADELTEHAINASSTIAIKPELRPSTTVTQKPSAPAKPQITTKEHLEKTTVVTTEKTESSNSVTNIIASFFKGKYYFDGEMISGGEKTPLEVAMNGSDFQLFSEMDGKDISIMNLNSKIYMLNPDTKKYAELTSSFQKMMGVDASQFSFEFNNVTFNGEAPSSVTKAQYNNQDAVCYTYKNENNHMEFITVNDEIKQMTLFDKDGTANTVLVADEFLSEIPEEMLNFKGYSKTNMLSFISSLM